MMAGGSTDTTLSWSTAFSMSGTPIPSRFEHLYQPIPRITRSQLRTKSDQYPSICKDRSPEAVSIKRSSCDEKENGHVAAISEPDSNRVQLVPRVKNVQTYNRTDSRGTIGKTKLVNSKIDSFTCFKENSYSVFFKPRRAFPSPPRRTFVYSDHSLSKKPTDETLRQTLQSSTFDPFLKNRNGLQKSASSSVPLGSITTQKKKRVSFEKGRGRNNAPSLRNATQTDDSLHKLEADIVRDKHCYEDHFLNEHDLTRSKEESALECPCQKPVDNSVHKSPPFTVSHKPGHFDSSSKPSEKSHYKTFKNRAAISPRESNTLYTNVLPTHNQDVLSKSEARELFKTEQSNLPSPIRASRNREGSKELPRSSSPLPFCDSPDSFLNISSGSYLNECVYSRQPNKINLGGRQVLYTNSTSPKCLPDQHDINTSDLSHDLSYVHSRLQEHSNSLHNHSSRLHDILDKASQAIQARHSLQDSFSESDRVQTPLSDSIDSGDDSYLSLPSVRKLPVKSDLVSTDDNAKNRSTNSLAFSNGIVKLIKLNTKCASTDKEPEHIDSRYVFQPLSHQNLFKTKELPPCENKLHLYTDLRCVNTTHKTSITYDTSQKDTKYFNTTNKSMHRHSTGSHILDNNKKDSKDTHGLLGSEQVHCVTEKDNHSRTNIRPDADGSSPFRHKADTNSSTRRESLESGCENPVFRLFDRQLSEQAGVNININDTDQVMYSIPNQTISNLTLHHANTFSTKIEHAYNQGTSSGTSTKTTNLGNSAAENQFVVQQKTIDDSGVFDKSVESIKTCLDNTHVGCFNKYIRSEELKTVSGFDNELGLSHSPTSDNRKGARGFHRSAMSIDKIGEKLGSNNINKILTGNHGNQDESDSLVQTDVESVRGANTLENVIDHNSAISSAKDITVGDMQSKKVNTSDNSKSVISSSTVLENNNFSTLKEIIRSIRINDIHPIYTSNSDNSEKRDPSVCFVNGSLDTPQSQDKPIALQFDQTKNDQKSLDDIVQTKTANSDNIPVHVHCDTNACTVKELSDKSVFWNNVQMKEPGSIKSTSMSTQYKAKGTSSQSLACDEVETSELNSQDLCIVYDQTTPISLVKGLSNQNGFCDNVPTIGQSLIKSDVSGNVEYLDTRLEEQAYQTALWNNEQINEIRSPKLLTGGCATTLSKDPTTKEVFDQNPGTLFGDEHCDTDESIQEELSKQSYLCDNVQIYKINSRSSPIEEYNVSVLFQEPIVTGLIEFDKPKSNLLEIEQIQKPSGSSGVPQALHAEHPVTCSKEDVQDESLLSDLGKQSVMFDCNDPYPKHEMQLLNSSAENFDQHFFVPNDLEVTTSYNKPMENSILCECSVEHNFSQDDLTDGTFYRNGFCNDPTFIHQVELPNSSADNIILQSFVPNDFEVTSSDACTHDNAILCECSLDDITLQNDNDLTDGTIFTNGFQAFHEEAVVTKPLRIAVNTESLNEFDDTNDDEDIVQETDRSLVVSIDRPLPRELLLHRLFLSPLRANYFDFFRFFGRRPLYNASFESSILRGNPNFLALAHFHASQDLGSRGAESEVDEFPDARLFTRTASEPCLWAPSSKLGEERALSVVPVNQNRIHRRTLSNLQDYVSYGLLSRRMAPGRSLSTAQTLYRVMCHILSKPEQPFLQ